MSILRRLRRFLGVLSREVPVADTDAVESESFAAATGCFWFRPEIKLDRLPSVAAFRLQSERSGRFVAAMHHAIFTTRIARDAVDDAVFVPLNFFEQLGVARIMRVGH